MQVLCKLLITGIVVTFLIAPGIMFIRWTWRSEIDPRQTAARIFGLLFDRKSDLIATRDAFKIYQGGIEVGNVTVDVDVSGDELFLIFPEVCDTGRLDKDKPFEYRNYKLTIVDIEEEFAITGSPLKKDVKRGMRCQLHR
jgi:hypothetical protein